MVVNVKFNHAHCQTIVEIYLQNLIYISGSDLRQIGGFLRVLRFPPPIKLTATI
jgi:hypothetical protein